MLCKAPDVTMALTIYPSQSHVREVRERGVEPPRPFGHTDLNRARLPFRHSRLVPLREQPNQTSTQKRLGLFGLPWRRLGLSEATARRPLRRGVRAGR